MQNYKIILFCLCNFDACCDDNDNNNYVKIHDEDVDRTDFTRNLTECFKIGGQGLRSEG